MGFTFQWGGFAFQLGGTSFLSEGVPHREYQFWREYGQVYLYNVPNMTENKWITRAKLGGKTLMSKNTVHIR